MILTDEDISYIREAYDIINKAHFPNSNKVTDVYNRVFADRVGFKPLNYTTCGSCIRLRVLEMEKEMKKIMDKEKQE